VHLEPGKNAVGVYDWSIGWGRNGSPSLDGECQRSMYRPISAADRAGGFRDALETRLRMALMTPSHRRTREDIAVVADALCCLPFMVGSTDIKPLLMQRRTLNRKPWSLNPKPEPETLNPKS